MPGLVLQRNNQGPEFADTAVPEIAFSFRGHVIPISTAPELPCTILPRTCKATIETGENDRVMQNIHHLVQTGQLPDSLQLTRQHIEYRARSCNLLDPVSGNIYIVQGFGFGEDRTRLGRPEIIFGMPQNAVSVGDYDSQIDDGIQMGTRYIAKDGGIITVPNTTALGGIAREKLLLKIANTEKAARMLQGLAIIPEWKGYGLYPEMPTNEGMLAWGVYSLPLHIPSYQLAEISHYFEQNGIENSLFNEYVFKVFKTLRCLHNKDYVHGHPHKGNLHVAFDGSGQIRVILTDWSTMYNIGKHRKTYLSTDDAFALPAKQQACAIDFNTALSTLLEAYAFFQVSADPRIKNWLIGLTPPHEISVADYMRDISRVTTSAILGYILPIDFYPSDYAFKDEVENGFGAIMTYSDLAAQSLEELDFRKYAVQIGDNIIRGARPGGKRDELFVAGLNNIREIFLLRTRNQKLPYRKK